MSGRGRCSGEAAGRVVRWRRRPAVLALVAALAGLVLPGAGAERLRIATYNVENYGPANRTTASGYRPEYPKPEAEKAALREVVRLLAADVLVLQEMGPRPYLEELRRDLGRTGVHYPHAALASAADADRHVAVLSRRPLKSVHTHTDLEFRYLGGSETVRRGLLEATIDTAAGELTLFAVHLKSRFTERPDDPLSAHRRAGEATAIRDRILRRFPTPAAARFLVLGDCNDNRASRPVAALQKRGRTEIAALLPAADTRGEVWTHHYRREETYTRVDLILVSPGLRPAIVDGVARIYDGPAVAQASDHRPVFVVLEVPGTP
jgi:endonuclease/exonuclease/phosphatase family metal-dependent hydrolase